MKSVINQTQTKVLINQEQRITYVLCINFIMCDKGFIHPQFSRFHFLTGDLFHIENRQALLCSSCNYLYFDLVHYILTQLI